MRRLNLSVQYSIPFNHSHTGWKHAKICQNIIIIIYFYVGHSSVAKSCYGFTSFFFVKVELSRTLYRKKEKKTKPRSTAGLVLTSRAIVYLCTGPLYSAWDTFRQSKQYNVYQIRFQIHSIKQYNKIHIKGRGKVK